MTTFCCFATGEGFHGELNGRAGPIGFFVSVFVDADDRQNAERKARQILDTHSELTLPGRVALPAESTISFKVVHELEHVVKQTVTEFLFFDMDET